MIVKDGTRVLLDSAMLQQIFDCDNAEAIKIILKKIIKFQNEPEGDKHEFLNKKFHIGVDLANKQTILFLCDRRDKCDPCNYPTCQHTADISHAANFKKIGRDYWEQSEADITDEGVNCKICLDGGETD